MFSQRGQNDVPVRFQPEFLEVHADQELKIVDVADQFIRQESDVIEFQISGGYPVPYIRFLDYF